MAIAATNEIVATGRRKTSVARVRMAPGTGKLTVNGRALNTYLTVPNVCAHAVLPLVVTENTTRYDVVITGSGGGMTGQAGAISLGLARALLKASPELKAILRTKGFLTRDSRMKERKKYGQPGARKRFQFSKR